MSFVNPYRFSEWTPARLFDGGANGAWYDPSDLSTVFSSGTTPAAVNDPVESMRDKSGNAMHMTRAGSSATRPILRQDGSGYYYLEFDGTNDAMGVSGATAAWGTISDMTVLIGYREISRPAINQLFALSDSGTTSRRWGVAYNSGEGNINFDCGGVSAPNRLTVALPSTGANAVGTFKCSTADSVQSIRLDGSTAASDATGHSVNTGPASLGNDFYIGATDSGASILNYANIRFYGGVFVKDQVSDADRDLAEAWLAAKCGVTL